MSLSEIVIPKPGASLGESGARAASPEPLVEKPHPHSWRRRRLARLTVLVIEQRSVQVMSIVAGFLLIRWLSVDDYAVCGLVSGFQGTVGILFELGLGGSIIALLAGGTQRVCRRTYGVLGSWSGSMQNR